MSMKYAVVIEKSQTGYGAYVPDLPGCIAVGETLAEIESLIREAIEFHVEGMREDGIPVPVPSTVAQYVEVGAQNPAAGANHQERGHTAVPKRTRPTRSS